MSTEPYHGFFRVHGEKLTVANIDRFAAECEGHNKRLSPNSAPSADPNAPKPKILLERASGLKNAIMAVLTEFSIKPAGKTSVLASEIVLTAPSEYFGGAGIAKWDMVKVEEWKKAALKMLKDTFGKRLASVIFHGDESAPHIHAYVVPLVKHKQRVTWSPNARKKRYQHGQSKIAGREYFTRNNMIAWQDAYGKAIEPLGLLRGKRGSKAKHREMREAQYDLEIQAKNLRDEAAIQKQITVELRNKVEELEKKTVELSRAQQKNESEWLDLILEKNRLTDEKRELDEERKRLRKIPIQALADDLGFAIDSEGYLQRVFAEVPHRVFITGQKFRIESFSASKGEFEKLGSGAGAIDLMRRVYPKTSFSDLCNRLGELFPNHQAGIVVEILERKQPDLWKILADPKGEIKLQESVEKDADIKI